MLPKGWISTPLCCHLVLVDVYPTHCGRTPRSAGTGLQRDGSACWGGVLERNVCIACVRAGWQRMALQVLFFGPEDIYQAEPSFRAISNKVIVSPIVRKLVYNKVGAAAPRPSSRHTAGQERERSVVPPGTVPLFWGSSSMLGCQRRGWAALPCRCIQPCLGAALM